MERRHEGLVDRARQAVARQAWEEAHALLSEADAETALDPDVLELLADSAYLSGHPEASLEAWERVHEGRLKEGDRVAAAVAAVHVTNLVRDAGQEAHFRAWVRRAEGLLEGVPESAVHGYLAVARASGAFVWGDLDAALAAAREAVAIGVALDEPGVAAAGKNLEGRALILKGEVEDGLALLEETALTALSGTLDPIATSILYCSTICALQSLAEYERAEELTQAMERHSHRHAIGAFHGWCRVHSAEVKRFRGAWEAAEEEASLACEELRPYIRLDRGWPMALVGDIRLRRGDLPSAEEAMLESHEMGWEPQPGLALLRLAQGEAGVAAASIRDAIENPSRAPSRELPPNNDLRMAPLLAAQVEIALATEDMERAEWAAGELDRIAGSFGTKALRAGAATAREPSSSRRETTPLPARASRKASGYGTRSGPRTRPRGRVSPWPWRCGRPATRSAPRWSCVRPAMRSNDSGLAWTRSEPPGPWGKRMSRELPLRPERDESSCSPTS